MKPNIETRLAQSVRSAVDHGEGLMSLVLPGDSDDQPWQEELLQHALCLSGLQYLLRRDRTPHLQLQQSLRGLPGVRGIGLQRAVRSAAGAARSRICRWLLVPSAPGRKKPPAPAKACKRRLRHFSNRPKPIATHRCPLSLKKTTALLHGDDRKFIGVLMQLEKEYATTKSRLRLTELRPLSIRRRLSGLRWFAGAPRSHERTAGRQSRSTRSPPCPLPNCRAGSNN